MIDKELYELLEPGVRAMGYEMVAVEMSGRGDTSIVRVYIDTPQGITVEDCAGVSDQVSAILDVEDPIPGHYTLEVSSPGFDRPLRTVAHFEAVMGQKVKIKTSVPVSGRRGFTGTLTGVTPDSVSLEVDGELYELQVNDIFKARLVPEYGAEAGRSKS